LGDNLRRLYIAIAALSLGLMALGAYSGDFLTIFVNARLLCLSCIGVQ